MNRFIDTHAHLDVSQFDNDREDIIRRAAAAGVDTIVTVGTDMTSSREAVRLAETHEGLYAAVGFHPQDARLMQQDDIPELNRLAQNTKVVAIGETGLDYYRMNSPRDIQIQVLKKHLDIAAEHNLPVIIHARQAENDMPLLLEKWVQTLNKTKLPIPGIIHCFSGDTNLAGRYLKLGFYIAFGAYTGYPSSRLSDVVRSIQHDRLLLETDCPFLPPQSHRGKRNEPSYIPLTAEVIARIRGESLESIAKQTTENAIEVFRLSSKIKAQRSKLKSQGHN